MNCIPVVFRRSSWPGTTWETPTAQSVEKRTPAVAYEQALKNTSGEPARDGSTENALKGAVSAENTVKISCKSDRRDGPVHK